MDFWTLLILLAIFRGFVAWLRRRNAEQSGEPPPSRQRPRPQRTPLPTPTRRRLPDATRQRLPEATRQRLPEPVLLPGDASTSERWRRTEPSLEEPSVPEWSTEWDEDLAREPRDERRGTLEQATIEVEQPERDLLERLRQASEAAVAVAAATRPPAPAPVEMPPKPASVGSSRWLHDELRDPQSVRTALVLREVLGPPRAHRGRGRRA